MRVVLICATTLDGFIARHSKEITRWTMDLILFKKQTMGHTIIMGHNTFNALDNELRGRSIIVPNKNESPKAIIDTLKKTVDICYIAGGGKTNSRFIDYITHIYITPHPIMFGGGVGLFNNKQFDYNLSLQNTIDVLGDGKLFQYQYKVIK